MRTRSGRRARGSHGSERDERRAARAGVALALVALTPTSALATSPASDPPSVTTTPGAPGAPGAPSDTLTPPRLISIATVPYPAGGHGDGTVVLELLVDRAGVVTESRAVTGEPPFSEAAARAARAFRFEPALRAGGAVRARIRFVVRFVAETAEPAPSTSSDAMPASASAGNGSVPAYSVPGGVEVQVEGERPETAVSRLGHAEVRQMPGAFGDPFRAIEALPGVTPIVSGLPYFFVRGAPPGNVGYFIDGVRVPLLYHVAAGPAVIHPALIETVDLYPGGYPARYGRFAGGIVAGETRAPANELHGEAGLRLVDAGGLVEGPLFGNKVTGLVSGRYGYPGIVLQAFAPEAILEYWDYQARASVDVGSHGTASVFAFGAYDFLGKRRPDGTIDIGFATEFHRVDLRYDHRFSPHTTLRVAATTGFDESRGNDNLRVRDRLVGLRAELRHELGAKATLRAGADAMLDVYDSSADPGAIFGSSNSGTGDPLDPTSTSDLLARVLPSRRDFTTGAWGDVVIHAARGVRVTPGLRLDLYTSGATSPPLSAPGRALLGVDPRISAEFDLTAKVRLLHALGVAHQPPSFVIPLPGVQPVGKLQTSLQHSFGVEAQLPEGFVGTLTLFHNAIFDLTDVLGSTGKSNQFATQESAEQQLAERALGSTVGLEVYLRRPLTRRLGGFLAYTLSRSTRSGGTDSTFVANFDRTHVFQVAAGYDLGRGWRGGARAMLYTGVPIRDPRPGDPARLPPFFRIDVRLEKRWRLGERGHWAFVFEVLNATLSQEYLDQTDVVGPVTIPSVGVEAAF